VKECSPDIESVWQVLGKHKRVLGGRSHDRLSHGSTHDASVGFRVHSVLLRAYRSDAPDKWTILLSARSRSEIFVSAARMEPPAHEGPSRRRNQPKVRVRLSRT